MGAAAWDLTTLASVKVYLAKGDTGDDALLQMLVSAASRRIATEICGEPGEIVKKTYTDTVNGNGGTSMCLANRPVISVASVMINGDTIPKQTAIGGNGWAQSGDRVQLVGYRFSIPASVVNNYGIVYPYGADLAGSGVNNVSITYDAGFDPAAIPADLDFACVELVAWIWRGRDHIGIASRSVSGEPQTYQGTWAAEQSQGGLPASVAAVIRTYRQPRV